MCFCWLLFVFVSSTRYSYTVMVSFVCFYWFCLNFNIRERMYFFCCVSGLTHQLHNCVVTMCVLCMGMRGVLTCAVLSLTVMNYCLYIVDCNV